MSEAPAGLLRRDGEAVLIALKVTPKASTDRVTGIVDAPDATGAVGPRLALKVTAPPADGAANRAVIKLLSKALSLPKTSLAIVSGETARHKVVRVEGADPAALNAAIRTLRTK